MLQIAFWHIGIIRFSYFVKIELFTYSYYVTYLHKVMLIYPSFWDLQKKYYIYIL